MEGNTAAPTPTNQNVPPPGAVNTPSAEPHTHEPKDTQAPAPEKEQPPKDGPAAQPKAPAKEPAPKPELHEIKVNGKVKKVSTDELKRLAQLAESAEEKYLRAAQYSQRESTVKAKSKEDVIAALTELNPELTEDEIFAQFEKRYFNKFVAPETLTDEQRKFKALEEELEGYRSERKKAEEQAKQRQQQADDEAQLQHWQKQITDIIDQYKLPKTKLTASRLAYWIRQNSMMGIEAPNELLIQQYRKERSAQDAEINEYSYDDFVDRFGEPMVKKLIAENLKRLREGRAKTSGGAFSSQPKREEQATSSEQISMSEATRRLKAMWQG